jgi:hypothetical protein
MTGTVAPKLLWARTSFTLLKYHTDDQVEAMNSALWKMGTQEGVGS